MSGTVLGQIQTLDNLLYYMVIKKQLICGVHEKIKIN
jgi:hypothetical protein